MKDKLRCARNTAIFAIVIVSAACSTAAQRQGQAIQQNTKSAVAELSLCVRAVYNSEEFAPLRTHIAEPGTLPTLQQQVDPSFATDEEIKALFAEHPKINACRQRELDELSHQTPSFVPILASEYTRAEDSLIDLIQRKVTWGDHTRRIKELVEGTRAQLMQEGRRIDAGLEQSHEAELGRRQAAFAAIAQFAQAEAAVAAASQPVVTTCSSTRNTATCVTR